MSLDKAKYAELRHQTRQLQGSVNYWNNVARAARRATQNHQGARLAADLKRLAEAEARATASQQKLDALRAQFAELDPHGKAERQVRSTRTLISRTKRLIDKETNLAGQLRLADQVKASDFHEAQANKLKAKQQQLEEQLKLQLAQREHSAEQQLAQNRERQWAEHMNIAFAAMDFDPDDEQAFARADQRQVERLNHTDLELEDGEDAPPRH